MQSGRSFRNLIIGIKLAAIVALLPFVINFIQDKEKIISVLAAENEKDIQVNEQAEKQGFSFDNIRVEVGVPLKVNPTSKDVVYQWTITGADGSCRTFTTKANSYTPTKADMEKLITVKAGEDTASIYFSSLPVIYINNKVGYYYVGDEYSEADIRMQGNEKFSDSRQYYNGKISIKLRGNSTKLRDKRPFNIKLNSKVDLLGLGENKHYALLANDIDHTLMRNKLLYDFSGTIGMDTYEKSENVVVIFNNEYYGVYQLSELVDLGSDRVDIYDWEDCAKDASKAIVEDLMKQGELKKVDAAQAAENLEEAMCKDLSWMTSPYTFTYDINNDGKEETYRITNYIKLPKATGGALLEMDFFAFGGSNVSTMVSAYSQPLYFKSPEAAITNNTYFNYINSYIQSFEYAIHSTDFFYHEDSTKYRALNRKGGSKNSGYTKSDFTAPEYNGKHYSELFDMDSLVQNFLVCEYSMNWDSMKNSVFMYKDIDGLFHMGPEWDFDWAWGNINMFDTNTWYPTSWQTTEDAFTKEQYYQKVQWNRCLIRDPYFLVRLYEKYKEIRGTVIEDMIKSGGTIDTYAKQISEAAAANDAKWSYSYAKYKSVGFQDSVNEMKKFITLRVNWLDQQFASLDTLMSSLDYYKTDNGLEVTGIDTEAEQGYTVVTAKVKNSDIASIVFQVNGSNQYKAKVNSGRAVYRIPDSALASDADVLNVVQILAVDSKGEYIISNEEEGNYSMAKSNYAVFYSSSQGISKAVVNSHYSYAFALLALIFAGVGGAMLFKLKSKR